MPLKAVNDCENRTKTTVISIVSSKSLSGLCVNDLLIKLGDNFVSTFLALILLISTESQL